MSVSEKIIELYKLDIELAKLEGLDYLPGDLFEAYLTTRRYILQYFGLPESAKYFEIFRFQNQSITQREINNMIAHLQDVAMEYLLDPVLTDEQVLNKAQIQNLDPFNILPEIGISTHIYTLFIYNEYLLKNRDTIKNILHTLRLTNRSDVLSVLGNIGDLCITKIDSLKKMGLLYIDEYKKYMEKDFFEELNNLMHNITPFHSIDDFETIFYKVAYSLLNETVIIMGGGKYRLTEIEFYYFHDKFHPDSYAHKHDQQKLNNQWYFHGSGLDITFGDNQDIYAGVLIRGIKDIEQNRYIDGPLNVVSEIFRSIGNIGNKDHQFYLTPFVHTKIETPIKAPRVGIKSKPGDTNNFKEKFYRYLVEIKSDHKFVEKTTVANSMLVSGKYSKDEINKMFGSKFV